MTEQAEQLTRVSRRIAHIVWEFCVGRLASAPEFRMEELQSAVRQQLGIAPDSPGRILRDLRLRGVLDYEVVSRRQSLYRVTHVEIAPELDKAGA